VAESIVEQIAHSSAATSASPASDAAGAALAARALRLRLGDTSVLRDVSFTVGWGERIALFGPNGAGKSSLLRVIAGIYQPNSGELVVAGLEQRRHRLEIRRQLGVLTHQTLLYGELTVEENLRLYGTLYEVADLAKRLGAVLEQFGLEAVRRARVDRLSRGQQQRCALARTFLHAPPLLLLDEPETGLDLDALRLLEAAVLAGSQTVLVATHQLAQGRRLSHRALVLVRGRLVADEPMEALDEERLGRLFRTTAERG
jgi:heme ABC exporter ATP-binding subunit CcmA